MQYNLFNYHKSRSVSVHIYIYTVYIYICIRMCIDIYIYIYTCIWCECVPMSHPLRFTLFCWQVCVAEYGHGWQGIAVLATEFSNKPTTSKKICKYLAVSFLKPVPLSRTLQHLRGSTDYQLEMTSTLHTTVNTHTHISKLSFCFPCTAQWKRGPKPPKPPPPPIPPPTAEEGDLHDLLQKMLTASWSKLMATWPPKGLGLSCCQHSSELPGSRSRTLGTEGTCNIRIIPKFQ